MMKPSRPPGGAFQISSLKLNPQERLLLMLAVALLLVTGFLFLNYRQAQAAREKANKQLISVSRSLDNLKKDMDLAGLQKKKADLEKELSGPNNPWYQSHISLDIDSLISNSAVQTRVDVVRLALGKDTKKKLGTEEYLVEIRQVQVRGELANIVRLLDMIERGPFPNMRMDNMKMNLDKGIWSGSFDLEIWRLPQEVGGGRR